MSSHSDQQSVISRPYRDDGDFRRVRRLLIDTYDITPVGFNWEVRRWDGFRFHNADPRPNRRWMDTIRLWETEHGKLVGAVHQEGTGDAHLEVHPDFRYIEKSMLDWAGTNLASSIEDSSARKLRVFAAEYDALRSELLEALGYEKTTTYEVQRRLSLEDITIPEPSLTPGYILRDINPDDQDDCRRIAGLLNTAFNRDIHTAEEVMVFFSHAQCFRRGLDVVAETPDGSLAAYVGVACVEENQYGVFEPVCTHPDHVRKGLARSLMLEGLNRLRAHGATSDIVGTGDQEAANRLYDSIGFTEAYRKYMWQIVA